MTTSKFRQLAMLLALSSAAFASDNVRTTVFSSAARTSDTYSSAVAVTDYDVVRFIVNVTAQSGTAPSIEFLYYTTGSAAGVYDVEVGSSAGYVDPDAPFSDSWFVDVANVDSIKVLADLGGTSPNFTFSLVMVGINHEFTDTWYVNGPHFTIALSAGGTITRTIAIPSNCIGVALSSKASNTPQKNDAYLRLPGSTSAFLATLFSGATASQGANAEVRGARGVYLDLQANAGSATTFTVHVHFLIKT